MLTILTDGRSLNVVRLQKTFRTKPAMAEGVSVVCAALKEQV